MEGGCLRGVASEPWKPPRRRTSHVPWCRALQSRFIMYFALFLFLLISSSLCRHSPPAVPHAKRAVGRPPPAAYSSSRGSAAHGSYISAAQWARRPAAVGGGSSSSASPRASAAAATAVATSSETSRIYGPRDGEVGGRSSQTSRGRARAGQEASSVLQYASPPRHRSKADRPPRAAGRRSRARAARR